MRLGQLARKLALRPSEILEFLALNDIKIEDGSNAKLQNEHVTMIMQKFAPALLDEVNKELVSEQEDEIVENSIPIVEESQSSFTVEMESAHESLAAIMGTTVESMPTQPIEDKTEIIKAPKVALTGLKIIGKIDLPEPKKKEAEPVPNDGPSSENKTTTESIAEQPLPRRERPQKRERSYQQPRKNPIALQRERELEEAEQKRKIEAERKKEQRTRNYLNKVKSAPTKPLKLIGEQVEEMSEETSNPPKTWLGKFFKWLRS